MVFFLQLKPIAFMGIDNMGIFNGTFSHSSNRKSTIGNGEKFIDKTGPSVVIYVWVQKFAYYVDFFI
jgi:hypothetical protein